MENNYTPWSGPTQTLAHEQHASHENVVSPRCTRNEKTPFNLFPGKAETECRGNFEKIGSCLFTDTYFIISFCKNVLKQWIIFLMNFFCYLSVYVYCKLYIQKYTCKIIHVIHKYILIHSSVCVLNFMLLARKPNLAKFPPHIT